MCLGRLLLFVIFKLLLLKYLVFLEAHIHQDLNWGFDVLDKSTRLAVSQLLALSHQQIFWIVVYLHIIINRICSLPRWILSWHLDRGPQVALGVYRSVHFVLKFLLCSSGPHQMSVPIIKLIRDGAPAGTSCCCCCHQRLPAFGARAVVAFWTFYKNIWI